MNFSEIAQLITAFAALGGVIMGVRNGHKIQEVHLSINSRMDQLLLASTKVAHAEGVNQEKTEAAASIAAGEITVPAQKLIIEAPK